MFVSWMTVFRNLALWFTRHNTAESVFSLLFSSLRFPFPSFKALIFGQNSRIFAKRPFLRPFPGSTRANPTLRNCQGNKISLFYWGSDTISQNWPMEDHGWMVFIALKRKCWTIPHGFGLYFDYKKWPSERWWKFYEWLWLTRRKLIHSNLLKYIDISWHQNRIWPKID